MAAVALVGNMIAPGGGPASGCKVNSYIRNTTTRSPLYSDVGLTTPTTNPFVSDADGRLSFYFNDAIEYEWVVTTSDGATTLWEAEVVGGVLTVTYANGILIDSSWATPLATDLGTSWETHLGKALPEVYIADHALASVSNWTLALNAIYTAYPSGCTILFRGRRSWTFTTQPDVAPDNTILDFEDGSTVTCTSASSFSFFRKAGSQGSTYTLSAGTYPAGTQGIPLTSVSGLAVGDYLEITSTISSILYAETVRIWWIDTAANKIYPEAPLHFALNSAGTYTIKKNTMAVGGGIRGGVTIDGAGVTGTVAHGVSLVWARHCFLDPNVRLTNWRGANPADSATDAGGFLAYGCYGLQMPVVRVSGGGCIASADIHIHRDGSGAWGTLDAADSVGFGIELQACSGIAVTLIRGRRARYRAVKISACLGYDIETVQAGNSKLSCFVPANGSRGRVGTLILHPSDPTYQVAPSAMARSGGTVTATFPSEHGFATGHGISFNGTTATTDSFNGTFTVTRVSSTVITWTQAGANESAVVTAFAANNAGATPFATDDTVVVLEIDQLRYAGASDTINGDASIPAGDRVYVSHLRTATGTFTAGGATTPGTNFFYDWKDGVRQGANAAFGTAALKNTGQSGDAVPVCNGAAITFANNFTAGDGTGTKIVKADGAASGTGAGAFFGWYNGGALKGAIGNTSAIFGSAYDQNALIYTVGTFSVSESGGSIFGNPTGGAKGTGTINAVAVYDDNVLLSCFVFDAAMDGTVDQAKWDAVVPDRHYPEQFIVESDADDEVDPDGNRPLRHRKIADAYIERREHIGARKFSARLGTQYDPLTLDGYARHWQEKRHLTAFPNEKKFAHGDMSAGEWIQRLIEDAEIKAVLVETLNARLKTVEAALNSRDDEGTQ